MSGRILIVDDEQTMCEMLDTGLTKRGFTTKWRTSAAEALELVLAQEFDAVVADVNMRGMSGLELCERIATSRPDVPVVVITAFGSLETAIEAMRAGAYDFITKPFELDELKLTLERAVQHRTLREEVRLLRRAVDESQRFDEIVGTSPAMKQVYGLLERLSDSDASVLITGESGTGKELVARALHRRGRRAAGPFIPINCSAIPEALLENELFGQPRGAVTDSEPSRPGVLVQATGGTVFFDEIGDMPIGVQSKLLRALQERTARPVGADADAPFDVRVIAATNRDIETAVEERRFREDLFYRIGVVHVELPPLRARGSDILLLAQTFLEHFAAVSQKNVVGLSTGAAERLLAYHWPGNVRELQNTIERAVALTYCEQLALDDLPERIRTYNRSHVVVASDDPSELVPMDEVERRYVLRVLEAFGGNKTLAARRLGFDRKTLYRKLDRYGALK